MRLRQGTISVLVGCHSFVHSIVVIVAWKRLYGRLPSWWQVGCILLHDIGHWGRDYLDDYEAKKKHAELGAKVAGWLFGRKGYNLIIGHNAYVCEERSQMFEPDKYSWVIAPVWWMFCNTLFEPKLIRPGHTRMQSVFIFKKAMSENMDNGFQEQGHDIYLRHWAGER